MLLNIDKTKVMIFNYTDLYQFSTRLSINGTPLQIIDEAKLLGVIISSDLLWNKNTKNITRKAYMRMGILHRLNEYDVPIEDLVLIYILYIRSVLEQSAVVWHSSLTEDNRNDLERVQKTALKVILKNKYHTYEYALQKTNLEALETRRESLCLNFARKCLQNDVTKNFFPANECGTNCKTRSPESFDVQHAHTDRLRKSPIIYMQHLLNKYGRQQSSQ